MPLPGLGFAKRMQHVLEIIYATETLLQNTIKIVCLRLFIIDILNYNPVNHAKLRVSRAPTFQNFRRRYGRRGEGWGVRGGGGIF